MAKLALDAGSPRIEEHDSAILRHAAANAILSTVGGGIGYAMASIVKEACRKTRVFESDAVIAKAAMTAVIENSPSGSLESSLATAALKKTEGSIPVRDQAKILKETLEQIGKLSKPSWFQWLKGSHDSTPADANPTPNQAPPPALASLVARLPEPFQARVRDITDQATGLLDAQGLPAGSKELYHTEQIRGDFMATTLKAYLDATAGSPDAACRQKVERDLDLQLSMMKSQLDAIETRYRKEAMDRVSEQTQFLAQSFGTSVP
ncbi:MAG: hypothetical protein ACYCW6_10570 [Candidatus Xenobia bacterium]